MLVTVGFTVAMNEMYAGTVVVVGAGCVVVVVAGAVVVVVRRGLLDADGESPPPHALIARREHEEPEEGAPSELHRTRA